jgi:hypothetical protein
MESNGMENDKENTGITATGTFLQVKIFINKKKIKQALAPYFSDLVLCFYLPVPFKITYS